MNAKVRKSLGNEFSTSLFRLLHVYQLSPAGSKAKAGCYFRKSLVFHAWDRVASLEGNSRLLPAWVILAEKGQGIPAMLLFFSVFQALHSRCPQGCPLPLRQVGGGSHLQVCLAWYFPPLRCRGLMAAQGRRQNRHIHGMMWEIDGVWQCWGLCHLDHAGKAAVLGGMGWTLITDSFQLHVCWKQQTEIIVTLTSTPKRKKNPKVMWQIKHNLSLDLLLGTSR